MPHGLKATREAAYAALPTLHLGVDSTRSGSSARLSCLPLATLAETARQARLGIETSRSGTGANTALFSQ